MGDKIQYYTDDNGKKKSVIVPYQLWEKINGELETLQTKLRILTGIKEGLREVKEARKSGEDLQKLSDFIRENRS